MAAIDRHVAAPSWWAWLYLGVGPGQGQFGFAGKQLWAILDELRAGSVGRAGVVPTGSELVVRATAAGTRVAPFAMGVLIAFVNQPQTRLTARARSCDAR